jgi:opacity protein-like surface antigen
MRKLLALATMTLSATCAFAAGRAGPTPVGAAATAPNPALATPAPTGPDEPYFASAVIGYAMPRGQFSSSPGFSFRAGFGQWLLSLLAVEGSVGFQRARTEAMEAMPAVTTYGGFTGSSMVSYAPTRETRVVVPVEASLRLAASPGRVRPYALAGVGLLMVWLDRTLIGPRQQSPDVLITTDRISFFDAAMGFHAAVGVVFHASDRWGVNFEGRYQWGQPKLRHGLDALGSTDLATAFLSIGAQYAF